MLHVRHGDVLTPRNAAERRKRGPRTEGWRSVWRSSRFVHVGEGERLFNGSLNTPHGYQRMRFPPRDRRRRWGPGAVGRDEFRGDPGHSYKRNKKLRTQQRAFRQHQHQELHRFIHNSHRSPVTSVHCDLHAPLRRPRGFSEARRHMSVTETPWPKFGLNLQGLLFVVGLP